MQFSKSTVSIIAALFAQRVVADGPDTTTITSTGYSYSIPIDLSVISANLRTATDSRLLMLVSEFENAKGTSALISLASVYGSDFLEGTLTNIASLALNVATVSGNNDAEDSMVTASTTASISFTTSTVSQNTTAILVSSESSESSESSSSESSSVVVTSTALETTAIETSSASSIETSSTNNTSSTSAGAPGSVLYSLPLVVAGGIMALI
ncbi:hypothetical protein DASC09_050820 [Saccharomycopsis crataegensis]|uniref:Uncharacterized protein n=1 Tax=Saccharomycopsis crataegensis TaxID=43959 RepID=A0AAV5QT52_9ASCO|nr:hypothetical protein DASC09_050820 [Saccharomycopsis crataegensis]